MNAVIRVGEANPLGGCRRAGTSGSPRTLSLRGAPHAAIQDKRAQSWRPLGWPRRRRADCTDGKAREGRLARGQGGVLAFAGCCPRTHGPARVWGLKQKGRQHGLADRAAPSERNRRSRAPLRQSESPQLARTLSWLSGSSGRRLITQACAARRPIRKGTGLAP